MSTQTGSRKRKIADGSTAVSKKAKVAKSAEKPAPLKSAMKKARGATTDAAEKSVKPPNGKTKSAKGVKEAVTDGHPTERKEKTTIEDNEDGGVELSLDQTAALLAGFSSSEDEAESEADSEDETGVAISSLPKAPTAGAIQKRINQAISEQNDPETTPGVIYIGRIPHGFYEYQMKAYLSQFGDILNLRLARNPKTGKSRHYGFVEFASAAVADIVAKTMDKYLLFGHLLRVRRVPRDQINEKMWKGAGRRKKPAPMNRLEGSKLKRGATREEWETRVKRENKKRVEKAEKLKEMGYEFDMPVLKAVGEVPVKPKEIEDAPDSVELLVDGEPLKDGETAVTDVLEPADPGKAEADAVAVTKETTSKKRPASGKTQVKKIVKKVKA